MFTVLTGDPINGMSAYGLYGDPEAAAEYAEAFISPNDYWVLPVEAIDENEMENCPLDVRNLMAHLVCTALYLLSAIDQASDTVPMSEFEGEMNALDSAITAIKAAFPSKAA